MITETDDVRDVIDAAARVWPDLHGDRAAILRRLIERGAQGVVAEDEEWREKRRRDILSVAGSLTGVYPPNAAQTLKEEWPE